MHVLTSAHSILSDLIIHTVLHDENIVSSWSRYLPCFSVYLFCFKSMYFFHHCIGKNEPHVFLSMSVYSTESVACVCVCLRLLSQGLIFFSTMRQFCQSQWPRGLRHRSAAAHLLRSWVRIPLGAWIFVCCECCVLSGRGLCDELITRPEESD